MFWHPGQGNQAAVTFKKNDAFITFIVSGMPSSSVKNVWTGDLQRFVHMAAQLDSARYLQQQAAICAGWCRTRKQYKTCL